MSKQLSKRFDPPILDSIQRIERIATHLASRIGRQDLQEDFVGAGLVAFVEAGKRYNPSICDDIYCFAIKRVRGAMLDEIRRQDRLSRRIRAGATRLSRARVHLTRELGRSPSTSEISAYFDCSADNVFKWENKYQAVWEVPIEVGTQVACPEAAVDIRIEESEAFAAIHLAITRLPDRSKEVVRLHYFENMKQKEIAGRLSVSSSRVCQILKTALGHLRESLEGCPVTGRLA